MDRDTLRPSGSPGQVVRYRSLLYGGAFDFADEIAAEHQADTRPLKRIGAVAARMLHLRAALRPGVRPILPGEGEPFCNYHAGSRVLFTYATSPEAKRWLQTWTERFRNELRAAVVVPRGILTGTLLE